LVRLARLKSSTEKALEKKKTPTENEIKAAPQIEKLLIQLKNDGRKPGTVKNYRKTFTRLLRANADLFDPESVKATLAKLPNKDSAKKNMVAMLTVWFDFNQIRWKAPKYSAEPEIPYIPTEKELDQLISALWKKTATFCQLLKETGARAGEIAALKWTSFDFQQRTVRIKAEKGSNSRILPVSLKALDMLCNLPRNRERIFSKADSMRSCFFLQRRRIAKKLCES
jgi:integrase